MYGYAYSVYSHELFLILCLLTGDALTSDVFGLCRVGIMFSKFCVYAIFGLCLRRLVECHVGRPCLPTHRLQV
jgi:hypothetical protein